MARLLKFAVVAIIVIFAFSKGLPWLKQELGGGTSMKLPDGDDDGGVCVALAMDANRMFGDSIRAFSRPPIDLPSWDSAKSGVEAAIYEADLACSCIEESCGKGSEALSTLRGLLSGFDSGFRGNGSVPLNGAREQLRINRLLDEASELARHGS
jgi:hypothetical protein